MKRDLSNTWKTTTNESGEKDDQSSETFFPEDNVQKEPLEATSCGFLKSDDRCGKTLPVKNSFSQNLSLSLSCLIQRNVWTLKYRKRLSSSEKAHSQILPRFEGHLNLHFPLMPCMVLVCNKIFCLGTELTVKCQNSVKLKIDRNI